MLTDTMRDAIRRQVMNELRNASSYLSGATWLDAVGYTGMAKWMYAQAEDERGHARRFMNYLTDHNTNAVITEVAAPAINPVMATGIIGIWEQALGVEIETTDQITALKALAEVEHDCLTFDFLDWFTREQVEEMAYLKTLLDRFGLFGQTGTSLLLLDREIGEGK